jgi:hypothetical protein
MLLVQTTEQQQEGAHPTKNRISTMPISIDADRIPSQ